MGMQISGWLRKVWGLSQFIDSIVSIFQWAGGWLGFAIYSVLAIITWVIGLGEYPLIVIIPAGLIVLLLTVLLIGSAIWCYGLIREKFFPTPLSFSTFSRVAGGVRTVGVVVKNEADRPITDCMIKLESIGEPNYDHNLPSPIFTLQGQRAIARFRLDESKPVNMYWMREGNANTIIEPLYRLEENLPQPLGLVRGEYNHLIGVYTDDFKPAKFAFRIYVEDGQLKCDDL